MLKTFRLRQSRRPSVPAVAGGAATTSSTTSWSCEKAALECSGLLVQETLSASRASQSWSTRSATESSSSLASVFSHEGDSDPRVVGGDKSGTARDRTARVRSVPARGCLCIKTQQESLQRKYKSEWKAKQGELVERTLLGDDTAITDGRVQGADSALPSSVGERILDPKANNDEVAEACSATSSPRSRSVRFSDVTIHSHQWILGDNPSVTSGPPVTIEWAAFDTSTMPVDIYERDQLQVPWNFSENPVSASLRRSRMLRAGHSTKEIATAERKVRVVQQRRCANLPGAAGQLKKGMTKLWGQRSKAVAGRKATDEEDVQYLDEAVNCVDARDDWT